MLNRSLKYIVLVVINIIVLYVFISEDSELDGVIFDVTYVLDLLDSNKILKRKSEELNKENVKFSESIDDYKRLVSQTDLDLKISKTDLTYCDSQKNDLIELSERQAIERRKNRGEQQFSQMQCSDNLLKLELVNLQIQDLQKHIKLLNDENMATTSELSESNIKIDKLNKSVNYFESNNSSLLELIKVLRDDLKSPVYVKKLYVTPRYCEGTIFKDVICLEKVLVMATFSKLPFTDVLVKLKDSNGNVMGELAYNPRNISVVTFQLLDNVKYLKGDYEVSFEVDNLLLVEKKTFNRDENH